MSLSSTIQSMLRVNQAGEYGAVRIYQGQLDFTFDLKQRAIIEHMLHQEKEHLDGFNARLRQYEVAPTLLMPLWHVAGYAMGAITAMISAKTAHACTIAVEDVIDAHYEEQVQTLEAASVASVDDEDILVTQEFCTYFKKCQAEEAEHRDTATTEGGRESPLFSLVYGAVSRASKLAIFLSKRV